MGYSVHSSLQHVQSCYCGLSCCLCQGRSSSSLWSLRLCWLCCPIHIRLCWISICLLHPRRRRPSCRPRSCRRIRRCRKIRRQLCRSCPCCQREAEADADADAYYGYYGYARPYAYGLGYRSYGYGYPYAYYGKRSADAEPEAKADAALLYGAYGYAGLPYAGYSAYGAYPYAYGAYPYAYGAY